MADRPRGSVDNVNAIMSGLRNSGFAPSDVAYWAYTGTGTMEGQEPAENLRMIAALLEGHIHLVALADSGIDSVRDIEGTRVSLDEPGSGPCMEAGLILDAHGRSVDDVSTETLMGLDGRTEPKRGLRRPAFSGPKVAAASRRLGAWRQPIDGAAIFDAKSTWVLLPKHRARA